MGKKGPTVSVLLVPSLLEMQRSDGLAVSIPSFEEPLMFATSRGHAFHDCEHGIVEVEGRD